MKKIVTVKTFFEWVFSDENSEGVTISEKAIESMNDFTLDTLKQLLLECKVLPYHCLHEWTLEDEKQGDFNTKDLELVKSVIIYQ